MTEETQGQGDIREDAGAEEPIAALKDFQVGPSSSFFRNLRRKIHRRQNVSQVVSASWELPKIVFVELVKLLMHVLTACNLRKGSE